MSLTIVSKVFRKGIVLFAILVIVYYLSILVFIPFSKKSFKALFPDKNPPTPIYGTLPPLEFVQKELKDNQVPSISLDTKDGKLPSGFPDRMTIYNFIKPIPLFDKGKDAVSTAAILGFYDDDLISSLKDDVYKWSKKESGGILEIDTRTRKLLMETNLYAKESYFSQGSLSKEVALNTAQSLFEKIGRMGDQLYQNGRQTVTLGRFTPVGLQSTEVESEAQVARVDFFRSINQVPILGPNPAEGLIYTYLRSPNSENPYLNYPIAESIVWGVKTQSNAVYPIITISEAWNAVKNNKGVVVAVYPEDSSNLKPYSPVRVGSIFVDNIFLAYYETPKFQEYLQPIYVFHGKYTTPGTKGGFISIYYPAISPQYIKPVE